MNKEKRILITGGQGFIGTALCNKLRDKGYGRIVTFNKTEYDITKEEDVKKLFLEKGPFDVVIHLAAIVGGISFFNENPGRVYYQNVMMNTLMQEYTRLNNVSKFIGLGSVLSYPKDTSVPFKEENLWKGVLNDSTAAYGLAKISMLAQGQAYRKQHGFNSIHLISTNVYGEGYDFNLREPHVIPSLIKKFENAKMNNEPEVNMWGSGQASREFLYIDDVVEAISLAMENYNGSEPVNIGSGEETTIKTLAERISSLVGYDGKIVWDPSKPEGKLRSVSDTSKAYEKFGFKASIGLDEGLRKTFNWYREWKSSLKD